MRLLKKLLRINKKLVKFLSQQIKKSRRFARMLKHFKPNSLDFNNNNNDNSQFNSNQTQISLVLMTNKFRNYNNLSKKKKKKMKV